MWPEIERYLPQFDSAVLTTIDEAGGPFSLRCRPQRTGEDQLTLALPESILFLPGPACLLFHWHDERLWNLKSFVLRGTLEKSVAGWTFRPHKFIPGMGIGGLRSFWRLLVQGRRTTNRYLKQRGLSRPAVPWPEFLQMFSG